MSDYVTCPSCGTRWNHHDMPTICPECGRDGGLVPAEGASRPSDSTGQGASRSDCLPGARPAPLPPPTNLLFAMVAGEVAVTSDDCYTPKWVFDAMGLHFDLDVAAPVGGPWHVPCDRYYTAADDGLTQPWDGLIWCNPPYSNYAPWAYRWAQHDRGVLVGLATARSRGRHLALTHADAVAFIDPKFERLGRPPRDIPQVVFVAFRGVGVQPAERLAAADRRGAVLYGKRGAA